MKGLAPSKPNLLHAARKREGILYEIANGTFRYGDHFPSSRRARLFSGRRVPTVSQALDQFLQAAQRTCAASTWRDYESAVDFHLKPAFGDRLLSDLSVSDLKAWIGGLTISPKRINNVLVPLRAVLKDAFADELIDRNPAARIRNLPHRFEEPDPLSPGDVGKLLEKCAGQVRNLFQFAIWTGLRTSELIALEWGDLDWNRKLIRERRCLVPANCYYEWKEMPVGKRPYCIRMEDESPFLIGGMWDVWHAREPEALFTFTVLTTFANEVSAAVHDRMPLIVQPKDYARWLDRKNAEIPDILAPYPAEGMIAYPVRRRVNDPKNDDERLVEPEAE